MLRAIFVLVSLISFNSFAECTYATISSIRVDDVRGAYRITFDADGAQNGCTALSATVIVKENNGMIRDTNTVLSLAMSALATGNRVFLLYNYTGNPNGANYLEKINIYNN